MQEIDHKLANTKIEGEWERLICEKIKSNQRRRLNIQKRLKRES